MILEKKKARQIDPTDIGKIVLTKMTDTDRKIYGAFEAYSTSLYIKKHGKIDDFQSSINTIKIEFCNENWDMFGKDNLLLLYSKGDEK